MINNIIKFIKKNWLYILMLCAITALSIKIFQLNKTNKEIINKVVVVDNQKGSVSVFHDDQEWSDIKNENKALYDSLKIYKNQIKSVTQFKYIKEYTTDTIYCDTTQQNTQEFNYCNNDNDTITYNLTIASMNEPNWYKLNVKVSDKFTIVNKKIGNMNQTDITSSNGGQIEDVIVFNKKEKNFWKRFSVGPSVSAGYDVVNKRFGVMVGGSVTFDLLPQ